MSKRILIISFMMLLITVLLSANVFAATINSASIIITPSKTEYQSGETIELTVSLKDLNASSGILGLGAYIEYDSNLLTLNTTAKGLSDWSDADISQKTNRFATTKNSHSSNNEDILRISLVAKDVSSDITTSIKLKKVEISNGTQYDISEVSTNITIKPKSSNPDNPNVNPDNPSNPNNPNNPDNPNKPGNDTNNTVNSNTTNSDKIVDEGSKTNNNDKNSNDSNNNNNNNSNDSKGFSILNIPALGASGIILILIVIAVIIAVIIFIKMKKIDKKIKAENENNSEKNDENK